VAGRLPDKTRLKVGIALFLGALAVIVVPRTGSGGTAPPLAVLFAGGLAVGIISLIALYLVLAKDLNLPVTVIVYTLVFNALIVFVKFVIAPNSVYEVNARVSFEAFATIADPIGAIAGSALVLILYATAYWLIYRLVAGQFLRATQGKRRLPSKKLVLGLLGGMILVVMVTGGIVLIFPLIGAQSGFDYLRFVFTSTASLLIAISLAFTAGLAGMAFKTTGERAAALGDTALLISFFWVGLAFLALYHALWVVYILVLTSIWPLRVIVPK